MIWIKVIQKKKLLAKDSIVAELRYYFDSENRQQELIVLYPCPYRLGTSIEHDLKKTVNEKTLAQAQTINMKNFNKLVKDISNT